MQKPSLGRVVLTTIQPALNNGDMIAPAVIVRVWDDHHVNVRVLTDDAGSPPWKTSLTLVDEQPEGLVPSSMTAWWPPRV